MQRILERGEIESLDHIAIARLRLPPADGVFGPRAARLRRLAAGDITGTPVSPELSGYLTLMAELVEAQNVVFKSLTNGDTGIETAVDLELPDQHILDTARQYAMPPLPAFGDRSAAWHTIFERLLHSLEPTLAARPQLAPVLGALRAHDKTALDGLADAVLAQRTDALDLAQAPAQAPFVAAALQVLWTYRASKLLLKDVAALETGALCPVCGSLPVASVIRIGGQSQGYRYLHCGLCASEWHMVRVKCSHCEKNANIAYLGLDLSLDFGLDQGLDLRGDASLTNKTSKANDPQKVIRAETCDDCHTYRKIVNQEHDYDVDPLADDLASLMLDVLVSEAGYTRASMNPLLWFGNPE